MLSLTDNFLYVIDAEGRQQLFDVDKLKSALQEAFENSGNANSYLAEDIACAVEAAMQESLRCERIFTQSEVDAAVNRILENAGYAQVAQVFRRANSHLYIALDVNCEDAEKLISRHLGLEEAAAGKLAEQVVGALKTLKIASASPALYLELARYYEHNQPPVLAEFSAGQRPVNANAAAPGKALLRNSEIADLVPESCRVLWSKKIIALSDINRVYPNFRLSLNLSALAEHANMSVPLTELEFASALYDAGEKTGILLNLLCKHLQSEVLPLYLVLTQLDVFTEKYLGITYPEGRNTALEIAGLFRNALGFPVKKVRCRTKRS
ncbi:MAG: hypothetical protein IKA65_10890 [Lentisphaeria bacterium]|nr:hypothetical protein [Lentisphaeria bacterium]